MPQREQRPYVGFSPTMPQNAAGWRIEPPVSVPVAPRQRLAATAAAEPPEEPPGTSLASLPRRRHGEATGPKHDVSLDEPIANSSLLSLPRSTAPSRQRLAVTVDSYGGLKPSRICEHAVVRTPSVQNRSLMPSGRPSSEPPSPFASRASEACAISRARSGVSSTKALTARALAMAAR